MVEMSTVVPQRTSKTDVFNSNLAHCWQPHVQVIQHHDLLCALLYIGIFFPFSNVNI